MNHFFASPLALLRPVAWALVAAVLATSSAAIQAQQLTPAQIAYVKTEARKADEAFVKDVAQIVDVRSSIVAKSLPERGRIADPVARLVAGLERSLGKPLTDEQKAAIQAADLARQKHVQWATANAAKR